jgi:NAD(P)-dependent dehydrogenase (short-subunit alcohol dehydrogenase family)
MILITGASRGIGKYLLQKFISTKENVFGTYNSTKPEVELNNYLSKVDINNLDEIKEWFGGLVTETQPIILLNCAGTNYNSFAHKSNMKKWASVIETNLIGTFNMIHEVLPIMREANYGRIINFSSIVAQSGIPGTSAYAASKAGLWGLTRAVAVENAKKGITINNLNLGYHDIGMIEEVPEEYQNIIKNKIPIGTFGGPENIWKAVNYIIESDYLTGTSIDINGGLF